MQKFSVQWRGRDIRCRKKATVSTQKSHRGRSSGDSRQKNSTAPPRAPSTTYPRSRPSARRRVKKNSPVPTARQYRVSHRAVERGSRSRKERSRSYSSPAVRPSSTDWPNRASCREIWISMGLIRTAGGGSRPAPGRPLRR